MQGFKDLVSDFSSEAVGITAKGKPRTAKVSLDVDTGEVEKNSSDFESMDDQVDAKEIPCHLFSKKFGVTWDSGISLENILRANMNKLCNALIGEVSNLFTTANFGEIATFDIAGATTGDAKDNLFQEILAKSIKGDRKILFANPLLYAKGSPTNQQSFDANSGGRWRGFDGFYEIGYFENKKSDNVYGVLTDGNGIGLISRVPEWHPIVAEGLTSQNIVLEGLGISVQFNQWASLKTRSAYASLDVCFGAGVYDKTGTILVGQS